MGPSGCGKSSLLNILSGYITGDDISGTIDVSDAARKRSYIMQEENLHKLITVGEAMMFSINFKTGSRGNIDEKKLKVKAVLMDLGLDGRMTTFMKDLSGGQQKRLSIALELVDDPSVMFLDEPTTGLDSSSSMQCIQLLKSLAQQGKTIICTIHTPSARLFELFDHLYAMSHGHCIYQGSSRNLLTFLSELDLKCPASYNPTDFLMEIANGDYGSQNSRLTHRIQNGANEIYREECNNNVIEEFTLNEPEFSMKTLSKSFINQLWNLMIRNFMIMYRDKSVLWVRLAVHITVAVLVGLVFLDTGREASRILSTFRLIYAMTMFLMYTGFYSLVTRFSLEQSIVKREHFNRWYSTGAYYLAMTLSDIPLMTVCTCCFVTILYVMSNQPDEEFRFLSFLAIQLAISFVSQGFGMMVGSVFKLKVSRKTTSV
jgi:ABC-type multidrug transport system ATPase subunit